jgi:hypothetical protein
MAHLRLAECLVSYTLVVNQQMHSGKICSILHALSSQSLCDHDHGALQEYRKQYEQIAKLQSKTTCLRREVREGK